MANKRILVFSPLYFPHVGGLESHAKEFNEQLATLGYEITVFTPRLALNVPATDEWVNYGQNGRVKVIRFPSFEIIDNYPVPKFWRIIFWRQFFDLSKEEYLVVVSRTRFFSTSILALIFAKIFRKKWIHIEHGSDFSKLGNVFFTVLAKIYDQILGRAVIFCADGVVANSQATAEFVKKLMPKQKCEVIYRGINEEQIRMIEPDLKINEKKNGNIVVVYLGRLIAGKGVDDLLSALSRIRNMPFQCFIIGDGPEQTKLKMATQLYGIADKVIFFGELSFAEAIAILKTGDIFVNPSYTEGLPTAVIEAALAGLALVVTDVGGTNEIAGKENLIFFKPHDVDALALILKNLLTNEQARKQLRKGIVLAVSGKFSWQRSISKYVKLFENINGIF